jgi:hypothetical protein
MQYRGCKRIFDKKLFTFDVKMLVLSQVFKRRNYSINDIFDFNVPGKFLKFEAGNAADFGFNIIDVFDDVGQKSLEAFFAHRIGQIANFCYQFVSDSP